MTKLDSHGINRSTCTEKTDLLELWNRFEELQSRSIAELRALCLGVPERSAADVADAVCCARLLLNSRSVSRSAAAAHTATPPEVTLPEGRQNTVGRGWEKHQDRGPPGEIARILALRKISFPTSLAWGLSLLRVDFPSVVAVQRAHRSLMKSLHPDRVGASADAGRAIELAREARTCCERALSRVVPPPSPRNLSSTVLCDVRGRRRIRVQWDAPRQPGTLQCNATL
jgi:hypothetical protein